jgi:hypothetical protein
LRFSPTISGLLWSAKMQKRDDDDHDLRIDPAEIFRPKRAQKYFGYRHSQLAEKVKSGEIPPPIPLSANGRAVGWTGQQIIEHHHHRLAAAQKRHDERDAPSRPWPTCRRP